MLNLDTHMLLAAFEGKVKAGEKSVLSSHGWGISVIVLWELAKLHQLKKIRTDIYSSEFRGNLSKIHQWPLDYEICRVSTQLDIRSDPADEIVAATSIIHNVPLLTRDGRIRKSRIVPLA